MNVHRLLAMTSLLAFASASPAMAQAQSPSTRSSTPDRSRSAMAPSTVPARSTMPRSLSARGTYWSSRRIPPAPSPFGTRTSSHTGRKSRRLPPPPPVPTYISGRSASGGSGHGLSVTGADETGRTDMSGRPVGFYPSSREIGKSGVHQSAMKDPGPATPPQNAQKNPFFEDPIKKQPR